MDELDHREDVVEWHYEPFSIPYTLDERTKRYIPDFQVVLRDGRCLIIEVKPPEMTSTEMNNAKMIAAKDFCAKNGWSFITWSPEAPDGMQAV